MITVLEPIFVALGVLAIFYFGALFGAQLVESDRKRTDRKEPLMEVVDQPSSVHASSPPVFND